jgi:P4 family phage/plasmid primase-like protien
MPGHLRQLEGSVINAEVIAARGYETLYGGDDDRARLKALHIPRWAWREDLAFPGILMPMYRVTGEEIGAQWKPSIPQEAPGGKLEKYASQAGVPNRLDVPPGVADKVRDASHTLWITEGIKKGDCLASLERAVITLTGVFNWRSKMGTLGDWEDVPLRNRAVIICFDSDARSNRNVMLAMQRLGRWLESKGAQDVRYLIVPPKVGDVDVKGVDDFFAAGGTMEILRDAALSAIPNEARDATFTDSMLADAACSEELDDRFRWAPGMGWMEWTGKVWKESNEVNVTEAIRQWVMEHYHQSVDAQHHGTGRDLQAVSDGWRGVLSAGRIGAVLKLAKGILACAADAFDSNPDLLNCPNGIVDLRTGGLQPPDQDLLMTKISGADFVKDAEHPDWTKALEALPEDVRDWYQLRVGQALTGHMTPDDLVIICQGGGANGKSTVYDACALAAGKYHVQVSDRTMLGGASDNHPTEIMDLMGARYAVLEETPESRRLDTNRLKKLAGTREITGRRIRQDPVTFAATHSLFINSNYKPVVDETDHGTWRRLALLRWPFTFRKSQSACHGPEDRVGDATLRDRLKLDPQAMEAALAWMAAGARRWYELEKIMPELPTRVTEDTLEWRKEADLILAFAPDEIEFDHSRYVISSELRTIFNDRLRERGQKEWSEKTFSARFGGHDMVAQHGVQYKVVKRSDALSTRKSDLPTASTFRAWVGIKFKENPGSTGETDIPVNDPFSGPDPRSVTPVTRPPITAIEEPRIGVNGSGVTGVTENSRSLKTGDQETEKIMTGDSENGLDDTQPSYTAEEINDLLFADLVDPFAEPVMDPFAETPAPPAEVPQIDLSGPIGFDLETASAAEEFTYGEGFVRLAGVIDQHGATRTGVPPEELVEMIEAAPEVYGHNALGFDGLALAHYHGLDWEAFVAKTVDTEPVARQAHPPRSRGKSSIDEYDLDHVAERYGVAGKTDDIKALARKHGGFDKIPKDDADYNAYLVGDLGASKAVREVLEPARDAYVAREHKILGLMGRMTLNGFKVDVPLLNQRLTEGEEKKQAALASLGGTFGLPLGREVMRGRGKAKQAVWEPHSSPLATKEGNAWLLDLWKQFNVVAPPRTDKGKLSTAAEALDVIAAHPRCPAELKEALGLMAIVTKTRTVYQTAATYLTAAGRVHPKVSMRQASGRGSITEPGMTVFGKRNGKHVERDIFIADEGHVIITCDLSQVDMRAVAGHCQDERYMALYEPGKDAHAEIAAMMGVTRDEAKPLGHGYNYGMGARTMIEREGHAPELVRAFFEVMSQFTVKDAWTEKVRDIGGRGELLDNGFGRLMRCDPNWAYTVAPALMGQGGARDITMEVLLRLMDRHPNYAQYLRTWVHDEFVFSVPADRAEEIGADILDAFTWEWKGVPILSELSRPGASWGECSAK